MAVEEDGVRVSIALLSGESKEVSVGASSKVSAVIGLARDALDRKVQGLATSDGVRLQASSIVSHAGIKSGDVLTAVVGARAWEGAADAQPIVIDNGTGFSRVGFAGDDQPQIIFPSIVGRPEGVMLPTTMKDCYVGHEVEHVHDLRRQCPFTRGVVTNWDDMERIWHHSFYSELSVAPEKHPVLLTEPPFNPKATRERVCQIMFEVFNVPKLYLSLGAALSLFHSGHTTGVVLSSGESATYVEPIYEGFPLTFSIKRVDVGGNHITEYLTGLLSETCRAAVPDIASAAQIIKETLCSVPLDFQSEIQTFAPGEQSTVSLSAGAAITFPRRFLLCPEALFQPSRMGSTEMGFAAVLCSAVMCCDPDLREVLFSNVVLAGGNTMFPGLAERLSKEAGALSGRVINVVAPEDRRHSSWVGGSHLACLKAFQDRWLTIEQYDTPGPSIVHRVCVSPCAEINPIE